MDYYLILLALVLLAWGGYIVHNRFTPQWALWSFDEGWSVRKPHWGLSVRRGIFLPVRLALLLALGFLMAAFVVSETWNIWVGKRRVV